MSEVRSPALRITGDHPQLPGQEMIRWPGTTDGQFAVLQLLCRTAIPVLIFFHRFRVNQVGNIDQHPVGVNSLATISSSNGLNNLWTCTARARALVRRSRSWDAFSRSLMR